MDITRWTAPKSNRLYLDSKALAKHGKSSKIAMPGADYDTDNELLVATIQVKLKRRQI